MQKKKILDYILVLLFILIGCYMMYLTGQKVMSHYKIKEATEIGAMYYQTLSTYALTNKKEVLLTLPKDTDKLSYSLKNVQGKAHISAEGDIDYALYYKGLCMSYFHFQESIVVTKEKEQKGCDIENYAYQELADKTNASVPDLKAAMIPIMYQDEQWVKADQNNIKGKYAWYNYEVGKWANVAIMNPEVRETYQNAKVGTPIKESDVLAYFVWIPRFRYQLFNTSFGTVEEQKIKVDFTGDKSTKVSGGKVGEWLTHGAFLNSSKQISGFWIAKYQASSEEKEEHLNAQQILLNHKGNTITNEDVFTFHKEAEYLNEMFALEKNVRLPNNLEWGALAILTQSKYGHCQKECEEMKESSTNNVYGVFDINNIYGEAVLALQYQELEGEQKEPNPDPSHSGFDILNLKKTKSVTFYEYGIHSDNFDRSILGDATGETNGWYQSEATFISQQNPWFIRGRNHIFSFAAFDGDAREDVTYRVVIES